ncbi:hypothetical protein [Dongshaea marina]|uniref:hypothetical protein n=1 Tax=Dongshaea marina TaxID=2047966 RepID=UPI00131EFD98|nr:hypothetical protein [Dongshaea marina]
MRIRLLLTTASVALFITACSSAPRVHRPRRPVARPAPRPVVVVPAPAPYRRYP